MAGESTGTMAGTIRTALKACRRHIVAACVFSALLNLLQIAPTIYMLQVYERIVPTASGSTLLFISLLLVFALLTLSLLDGLRGRLMVRAGIRLDRMLAPAIMNAALERGGSAGSRGAMREFDVLRQVLTGPAANALFDAPWAPLYVLVCFLVHPWIGVLGLLGLAVLPLIVWRSEKAAGPQLLEAQKEAQRAYLSQDQMLSAADSVRALGMRPAMIARQSRLRETMMQLQTSANFALSGYSSASRFMRLFLQSAALGLGAILAIQQQISAGAIFAAGFLVARALAPVEQLIGSWKAITQARASYASLNTLLQREEGEARTQLPAPRGSLSVEGVSLKAPNSDHAILSDIRFALGKGELLAVVGPSGAGKSSLMRILAGIMPPESGTVRLDGADMRDWEPDRLGRFLGFAPQEPSLFAGTVKENICRFDTEYAADDPGAIDEAVIAAAQSVGAHDLILRFPGGYDYLLGHGGGNLSSGQAQRVVLARAVYGSPSIVLLDEPNAHLDSVGDGLLADALRRMKEAGTTVIIVSHRLNILPIVDKMLVMNGGRVQLFGLRDEVLPQIAPSNVRSMPKTGTSA